MSVLYKIILVLLLSIFFVHCSKIEKLTEDLKGYPKEVNKQKILELVNEQRAKGCNCGGTYMPPAKPLVWNELLEKAAQIHSDDMSEHKFLGHTGSDNSSPGDRIYQVGYSWKTYGENVLSSGIDEENAVSRWIESAGHCKNIMNPDVMDIGVATQKGYWTMILGKK